MLNKKNRGFTLIEILLVIAVIAIILSLSLVVLRKQAQTARVNKTALEMQNVLQAAITYINDSGDWPINYTCNTSALPDPNFVNYLPNSDYQSNFGTNFCWARDGSTPRFWVALPLPGNNYQMAQQIASQLPNAYAVKNPNTNTPKTNVCDGSEQWCYVRAEVTQAASAPNGGVAAAGYCNPNGTIGVPQIGSSNNISCTYLGSDDEGANYRILFPCTNGQGNVVLAPNFLTMGSNDGSYTLRVYALTPSPASNCATDNGMARCMVRMIAISTLLDPNTGQPLSITNHQQTAPGKIGATFVGYCYQ